MVSEDEGEGMKRTSRGKEEGRVSFNWRRGEEGKQDAQSSTRGRSEAP